MVKQATRTTKKKTTKRTSGKKRLAVYQTGADLRTALLIVSLLANLFVVSVWIALQVTSQYDQALVDFFINR